MLEADLDDATPEDLVAEAGRRGVELLGVHTNSDLAPFGFRRTDGCVRLRSATGMSGPSLPRLRAADYARILDPAYGGLWGHKRVGPDSTPPAGAVVLGLYQEEEPRRTSGSAFAVVEQTGGWELRLD